MFSFSEHEGERKRKIRIQMTFTFVSCAIYIPFFFFFLSSLAVSSFCFLAAVTVVAFIIDQFPRLSPPPAPPSSFCFDPDVPAQIHNYDFVWINDLV